MPIGSVFDTEADAILDVLLRRNIPREAIEVERLATNSSENFWLSAELLRDLDVHPQRFLIVQKPYAERRAIATARRRWPAKTVRVTSQQIGFDEYCNGTIPVPRILCMLAGEAIRLQNYDHNGLIQLDEPIPDYLLEYAHRLEDAGYNARSLSTSSSVPNLPTVG